MRDGWNFEGRGRGKGKSVALESILLLVWLRGCENTRKQWIRFQDHAMSNPLQPRPNGLVKAYMLYRTMAIASQPSQETCKSPTEHRQAMALLQLACLLPGKS